MKKFVLKTTFILTLALMASTAYTQPPPPPAGGHGAGGNQPAGDGAPIGSGIAILLSLGAAYGGRKVYKAWQEKEQD
jgi:hypothetical protein